MTDSTLDATPAAAAAPVAPTTLAQLMQRLPGVVQGARWFWWIAALSAISAACNLAHTNINFSLGLAYTQLVSEAFRSNTAIALLIDALVVGGFYFAGLKAQQGRNWAFIAGAAVYLVDALIYANFSRWMPVAFHAFALYCIGKAFMDLQAAKKATGIR